MQIAFVASAKGEEMKILTLKGWNVLLDDADFDRLGLLPWFVMKGGYVARWSETNPRTRIWMAHAIIGLPATGMEIDHADRNRCNNQRTNLRFCTHAENTRNRGVFRNNSLGVKGVYSDGFKYRAQIRFDGQKINLGSFNTALEASGAYQSAAKRLFGQFCSG